MKPNNSCAIELLTKVGEKRKRYLEESYFREAWSDFVEVFSDSSISECKRIAVLMFKPEALCGGRVSDCRDFLEKSGFIPRAIRLVSVNRHICRELWRFQWNAASLDRIDLCELLFLYSPCLWLLLADRGGTHALPSSVRLSLLKGSADKNLSAPATLRSLLQVQNRIMSFIHVADEPADIVREMGILFSRRERIGLLREWDSENSGGMSWDRVEAAADEIRSQAGTVGFDVTSALRKWERATVSMARESGAELRHLDVQLSSVKSGGTLPWRLFRDEIERLGVNLSDWDKLLLGATFMQTDEPTIRKIVEESGAERWLEQQGEGP